MKKIEYTIEETLSGTYKIVRCRKIGRHLFTRVNLRYFKTKIQADNYLNKYLK